MQWCMLLFLRLIVLLLARVAADPEILQTDRGALESFSEIQSVNLLWRLIIEQQRTVATDRVAAETDESAREFSATWQRPSGESRSLTATKRNGANTRSDWNTSDETKKRSVFLTLIGANAYKLLRNLIAPAKTDTNTYKELVQALANHYSPTPAESVQRFKFHSRVHRPEESVATFVAELR